jgi:hypothetical protein
VGRRALAWADVLAAAGQRQRRLVVALGLGLLEQRILLQHPLDLAFNSTVDSCSRRIDCCS